MSWFSKESWKVKLKKWFPENKDLSVSKLKKERQRFYVAEVFGLVFSFICFVLLAVANHAELNNVLQIALTGVCIGGVALGFALYAQNRVSEVEVNFELRLREAIQDAKDGFA